METLLSAKQVQEILHIDRTTIYRMLKDGRLSGVKVGQQWRFSASEVDDLLSGAGHLSDRDSNVSAEILPLHCMQPVQDVFAEIAEIGAVTTSPDGEPLTRISNVCSFCKLILDSEKGRLACVASWKKLAQQKDAAPEFVSCHAGLQYARAPIEVRGTLIAMLVAGQVHARPPRPEEESARIQQLAEAYSIDPSLLAQAAGDVRTLDDRKLAQLSGWLGDVAETFEEISVERADLMSRLQQIAEMSVLEDSTGPG
ncbi:MAG: PocR ligand-binding domain-containing protein [Anaerolineales bacterium]|jgi:excisionase family DNA binding protein